MKTAKKPCALRAGHKGPHNSAYRYGEILPEAPAPEEYAGLCGKWMERAQTWCALPFGHGNRRCQTLKSVAKRKASQNELATAKQDRRRHVLAAIKLTAGCADCGFDRHAAALDFDHLDGTLKAGDISKMLTHSLATVLAEVAKTEVVCANCHRIRTASRKGTRTWMLRTSPSQEI